MTPIHCLFLEHDDRDFDAFTLTIEAALKPEYAVTFDHVKDYRDAIKKLQTTADTYQIFIADILFVHQLGETSDKKVYRPDGLLAVQEAVNHKHLVVVALSNAERDHPAFRNIFEGDRYRGDYYIDKDGVRNNTITNDEIRTSLYRLLDDKGHPDLPEILYDKNLDDPALEAIIENIGKDVLGKILRQIRPRCSAYKISYVAPGFSGAAVIRVDGKYDQKINQYLLKMSRDPEKLQVELDREPEQGEVVADLYIHSKYKTVFKSDGWAATVWSFRGRAITLLDYINSAKSPNEVQTVLEDLLVENLSMQYAEGSVTENTCYDVLMPNIQGKFEVLHSLRLLNRLIEYQQSIRSDFGVRFDPSPIRQLLIEQLIGTYTKARLPIGVYECMSHGDLHSRNVLIANPMRPYLIDPARRTVRHWASDPARLCADLWVNAWDRDIASHLWNDLPEWRKSILTWLESKTITVDPASPNENVSVALQYVYRNLGLLFQGGVEHASPTDAALLFAEWQFKLAFTMELLRMSTYDNFPTPKRCLCVVVASDILNVLRDEIPWK